MSNNTGGPAFPGPYANDNGNIEVIFTQQGMTLRDCFAAKAMQAMLNVDADYHEKHHFIGLSFFAYQCADAMLKAREA